VAARAEVPAGAAWLGPEELESAFQRIAKRADALISVSVGFINNYRKRVIDLEAKHRLPVMHTNPFFVPAGGLMSYSADVLDHSGGPPFS
jgi:hypothetical protein